MKEVIYQDGVISGEKEIKTMEVKTTKEKIDLTKLTTDQKMDKILQLLGEMKGFEVV